MTGLILRGSKNIFFVQSGAENRVFECRIKGKILKGVETYYNPLAPGDRVVFEPDGAGGGRITALVPRRAVFTRGNQKELGRARSAASQIIAANVDQAVCVTSPASPPFRPRFIDRVLVQAESAAIPAVIVCNKADLPFDEEAEDRLADFARIGYEVLRVSARSGAGMDALKRLLYGKLSLLAGQSGVGKSSLINRLSPDLAVRTGAINEKYDRGVHTTTMSSLLEIPIEADGDVSAPLKTFIIDTPGVRRFAPDGVSVRELALYMREFAPFAGSCAFGASCSHTGEKGCAIIEAVESGRIHVDRYESYLRMRAEMPAR
ncbi:MAG: ribosome small subunit-dependent GTPase A [Verrucomicrobiota bacterium]|jgi:ribosome biogenesis GTPase|nr:ribosome small subunit-dependent GTPase A [Verrucomicrobiota bacterium]